MPGCSDWQLLCSANQRSTHQHLREKAKTSQRQRRSREKMNRTGNRQWGLSGASAIDHDDRFDDYHAAFAYLRIVAARAIAAKTRFDSSSPPHREVRLQVRTEK